VEFDAAPAVELKHSRMLLRIRSGMGEGNRQAIVDEWYRSELKKAVPSLIAKWEPLLGVKVERFFVQKMKTKWGSCNAESKSIRLNTELAKKPAECLEYVVVHEMAHLIVRHHDDHFTSLMNRHLPNWKLVRQTLNAAPLAHSYWTY
jgi:predicted metal-dependent hydrolase